MRMGGVIAGDAQLVEEIARLARHGPLDFQAHEEFGEGLVGLGVEAHARGELLRQELRELAELDEGGVGVFLEVTLRERAEPYQLRVVCVQKVKVGPPARHSQPLEIAPVGLVVVVNMNELKSYPRAAAMRGVEHRRAVRNLKP